jgi:tRNA (cytidine/uridine-2'-O-)-methyltransferase
LDYWPRVQIAIWDDWAGFVAEHDVRRCRFFTTKTSRPLWEADLPEDVLLVFGPESRGLPESLLEGHSDSCVRLPMMKDSVRSLNLAVSVGIAAYEWARRFPGSLA